MLYKFKSQATGDVIMLAAQGDQFLRLLGREPAAQGILEVATLPQALLALERAIAAASGSKPDAAENAAENAANADNNAPAADPEVALHQRLWPMVDMLRRAQAAGQPVVWGV